MYEITCFYGSDVKSHENNLILVITEKWVTMKQFWEKEIKWNIFFTERKQTSIYSWFNKGYFENSAKGAIAWWSVKQIIAVSSVCSNAQCPIAKAIFFELGIYTHYELSLKIRYVNVYRMCQTLFRMSAPGMSQKGFVFAHIGYCHLRLMRLYILTEILHFLFFSSTTNRRCSSSASSCPYPYSRATTLPRPLPTGLRTRLYGELL